ncbi:MAG: sigma-70 family RNA polymerase sigma factor [Chloroflexi bacterium]|nr:MAG: sigma-70 family RNA polymerase sigma factor [Chloroflexota bacterium]
MELSDATLVLACRRGDAHAWEALVERYQRLICSIPRHSGLNEDEVADILQQVFTKLIEKLDDIEQPERIRAWLVTTARRETFEVLRRNRRAVAAHLQNIQPDAEEIVNVPSDAPLPEEILVQLEAEHALRSSVAVLDERCRTLLTLLYYSREPLSYAEIAARLGVSEGSIGPMRGRCFEKLRRILSELEN